MSNKRQLMKYLNKPLPSPRPAPPKFQDQQRRWPNLTKSRLRVLQQLRGNEAAWKRIQKRKNIVDVISHMKWHHRYNRPVKHGSRLFRASGIWHRVAGWVHTDASKGCIAFILKGQEDQINLMSLRCNEVTSCAIRCVSELLKDYFHHFLRCI